MKKGLDENKNLILIKLKLRSYGGICVKVIGNSMFPAIKPDDSIYITKVSRLVNIGDVILFFDGLLTIHRVVRISNDGFVHTKGDNNLWIDSKISHADIIGVWDNKLIFPKFQFWCGMIIAKISLVSAFFYSLSQKLSNNRLLNKVLLALARLTRKGLAYIINLLYAI